MNSSAVLALSVLGIPTTITFLFMLYMLLIMFICYLRKKCCPRPIQLDDAFFYTLEETMTL